jgi:hypothetical protein
VRSKVEVASALESPLPELEQEVSRSEPAATAARAAVYFTVFTEWFLFQRFSTRRRDWSS